MASVPPLAGTTLPPSGDLENGAVSVSQSGAPSLRISEPDSAIIDLTQLTPVRIGAARTRIPRNDAVIDLSELEESENALPGTGKTSPGQKDEPLQIRSGEADDGDEEDDGDDVETVFAGDDGDEHMVISDDDDTTQDGLATIDLTNSLTVDTASNELIYLDSDEEDNGDYIIIRLSGANELLEISDSDEESVAVVDDYVSPMMMRYFLRSSIVKIPALKLTQTHIDNVSSCSICLEEFQVGEVGGELECKHLFHKTCLEEWTQRCSTCPFCRRKIGNKVLKNT